MKKLGATLLLLLFLFGHSCRDTSKEKEEEFEVDVTVEAMEELARVKQVFYALPSPVEIAALLRSSGAIYNEDLLNPVENAANYLTTKSIALNLGIYITDLSYAGFFDQTQASINYMEISKELAERLGIMDAVDRHTLEKLEANLNNRDVVMDIISETYLNSSAFLQENERETVATMLFAGGFIEGLFIATSLADESNIENNALVDHIVDQKFSLELLMKLLEDNIHNDDVADLHAKIDRIWEIYGEIEISSSPVSVERDKEGETAVLSSSREVNITPGLFAELKDKVKNIRNSFVSY